MTAGHPSPVLDHERDDRATVAIFAIIISAVGSAISLLAARRLEDSAGRIPVLLGQSLFVTVAPFLLARGFSRNHYEEPQLWWRSQPAIILWSLAVSTVGGVYLVRAGADPSPVLSALGYIAAVITLGMWLRQGRQGANLVFICVGAAFGIWASAVAWRAGYTNSILAETIVAHGAVPDDQAARAAVAGINSIFVIPFLFSAVMLLAVELRKSSGRPVNRAKPPLKTDYVVWLLLLAVTIGVLPTPERDAIGIGAERVLTSQRYAIAVALFLLTISTTIVFWRRKRARASPGDLIFLLIFAPFMLAVLARIEMPVMFLAVAAGLGMLLLGRLYRDPWVGSSAILCLVAAGSYLLSASWSGFGFSMKYIVNDGADWTWWPYFTLVQPFWSWLYIYLRVREEDLPDIGSIRYAALDGRIADAVLIFILVVIGWILGFATKLSPGSGFYFFDVQRWVALPLLMAALPRLQAGSLGARATRGPSSVREVRLARVWLGALGAMLSITLLLNWARPLMPVGSGDAAQKYPRAPGASR